MFCTHKKSCFHLGHFCTHCKVGFLYYIAIQVMEKNVFKMLSTLKLQYKHEARRLS